LLKRSYSSDNLEKSYSYFYILKEEGKIGIFIWEDVFCHNVSDRLNFILSVECFMYYCCVLCYQVQSQSKLSNRVIL